MKRPCRRLRKLSNIFLSQGQYKSIPWEGTIQFSRRERYPFEED